MGLKDRLVHGWNAFIGRDPTYASPVNYGYSSYYRPDRARFTRGNEKSIVTPVYNRISLDVASIPIIHAKLDENGKYIETIEDSLNDCLSLEANKDQTARAFVQDIVISMFDEGYVAVVPIDVDINPDKSGSYDIETLRTGRILEWFPDDVKVRLYNDKTGRHEELIVPKRLTAIIENPFYSVMNEQNSTLKRLVRKMNLLDTIDERKGAEKLDLIIQLPYVIRNDLKKQQAEARRKDIEMQLSGSKYGIAYTDGTERITQLNRSIDNQLPEQVQTLLNMFYSQIGVSEKILNGTADEKEMKNYYNRTIEPIISAIADEFRRKFLTKTARTRGHTIRFFQDPFKLVPTTDLADLADKFTRNEIVSSNEFRQVLGMKPSDDPRANELRNKNMPDPNAGQQMMGEEENSDPRNTPLSELE